MKKILLSLLMCLVLVMSVFLTACGEDEDGETKDSGKVTLTMLVVTDRQVIYTDSEFNALSASEQEEVKKVQEQYAAVEAQLNKITKADYNTALEILYYTPEQYYRALENKLTATEIEVEESETATKLHRALTRSEKKLGNTDPAKVYEKFVEMYPEYAKYIADPNAVVETTEELDEEVYPTVGENQVDILFIGSYDKYIDYIEKGWLSKLGDALNSSAKKLTSTVYPAFLSSVKYKKEYYAIPNNTVIGEYTALLVNKEMCDRYTDITKITSLASAIDLIETVAKYEEGIDPVWCDSYDGFTNVHFWNIGYEEIKENGVVKSRDFTIDTEKFSILGTSYNSDYESIATGNSSVYEFKNLLDDEAFKQQLKALKTIEFEGYRGEEGSENDFAVGVIKGSGEEIASYEEKYYTVVLENPVATEEDLFKSMFAVSAYTSNLNRAMQIITMLNTDEEFRNLFQYGLAGENYKLTLDGCAERTDDSLYDMDIYKTGNMFIAYPDADRGMTHKTIANAKSQDLDVVSNPTMGFTLEMEDGPDLSLVDITNQASNDIYVKIEACKTIAELEKVIADAISEIEGGRYQQTIQWKAMSHAIDPDADYFSPYAIYYKWARSMGYVTD